MLDLEDVVAGDDDEEKKKKKKTSAEHEDSFIPTLLPQGPEK